MPVIKDRKIEFFEKRAGGEGYTVIEHLIDPSLFQGQNAMFARVIFHPGCSLGYHMHETNNETYYVLEGTGEYCDNNQETIILTPGMSTFTAAGEGHGIKNIGTTDLVLIALISNLPK